MKKIKVLGSGCGNCRRTTQLIETVAAEQGVAIALIKVEDMSEIMAHGVMSTPGVVLDGQVVHAGGVPDRQQVEQWLGNVQEADDMATMKPQKPQVLFLCTGNSCRSQMAEGFARHHHGDTLASYSAGLERHGLNPHAVQVMAEVGIDISGHQSKTLDDLAGITFDCVVTVCGHAHETCPIFPGSTRVIHQGFDDPPKLAAAETDPERALDHYRRVRDEIFAFIETLPQLLRQA